MTTIRELDEVAWIAATALLCVVYIFIGLVCWFWLWRKSGVSANPDGVDTVTVFFCGVLGAMWPVVPILWLANKAIELASRLAGWPPREEK